MIKGESPHNKSLHPTRLYRSGELNRYFGIDYGIVWDVVINKMPALGLEMLQIMQSEKYLE